MCLRARLHKLEHNKAIGRGCPACRSRRGLIAIADVTPLPDRTVANPAPTACMILSPLGLFVSPAGEVRPGVAGPHLSPGRTQPAPLRGVS